MARTKINHVKPEELTLMIKKAHTGGYIVREMTDFCQDCGGSDNAKIHVCPTLDHVYAVIDSIYIPPKQKII